MYISERNQVRSRIAMGIFALAMSTLLSGCWIKKTACRGLHNAMPGTCKEFRADGSEDGAASDAPTVASTAQPAAGGGDVTIPPAPTETVTSTEVTGGYALTRVTPEQLVNNIARALNYGHEEGEFSWYDANAGQSINYILLTFGVPLGGIDFTTTSFRDPATKAQTLLVARLLSAQIVGGALYKDYLKPDGEKVLFTKCSLVEDRPFHPDDADLPAGVQSQIRVSETRWNAQVDEFFLRFYARLPDDTERAAVKSAFLAAWKADGGTWDGWYTVIYAMLASQEFWHI